MKVRGHWSPDARYSILDSGYSMQSAWCIAHSVEFLRNFRINVLYAMRHALCELRVAGYGLRVAGYALRDEYQTIQNPTSQIE